MRPRSRWARRAARAAPLSLSAWLVLTTATVALASPHSKTCAHISGCSASVSSPPVAATGGQPVPASHLAVAVTTAPQSSAKARQASGTLMTNAEGGRRIRCGGYRFKAPATFQFQFQATGASSGPHRFTIGFTYEVAERITNTTSDGVHFCLAADFAFKTLSGRPAPARRLPDGTRGHVGLLPPCPQPLPPPGLTSAPCVENIKTVKDENSTTGVDVILKVRIPTLAVATVRGAADSAGGDPWGGG